MKTVSLNFDWQFKENEWGETVPVNLPHDYMVHGHRDAAYGYATGYFPGGEGIYEKQLTADESWRDRTILLNIEGAYMNGEVTFNGDLLAVHPYGYTPWRVDLSEYIRFDVINKLKIATSNGLKNSRWYSGSGLYRDVSLLIAGKQYIDPWDLKISTRRVDIAENQAEIIFSAEITNRGRNKDRGCLCLKVKDPEGRTVFAENYPTAFTPGHKAEVRHTLHIPEPRLWDVDDPELYTLEYVLTNGNEETDSGEVRFGIRTIEIDAKRGFRLNGKPMKLRGGCIHHDNGLLGACAFRDAEFRKIKILKECGYNAVRTAHNPPSTHLLDACDETGMLVLEESFDMWRVKKNPLDYHLHFDQWWQRDTESMVRRDRNHPCIYAWSIGNEIPELLGFSDGASLTAMQARLVRSLDERPISASSNEYPAPEVGVEPTPYEPMGELYENGKKIIGVPPKDDVWDRQTLPCIQELDLFGYNYMYGRYPYDAVRHPDRVIHCTESHPFFTYDYWQAVLNNNNCIGDFIWTAFDNMGEAGAGRSTYGDDKSVYTEFVGKWPWLTCWQGDCDLTGRRLPQSYYRKIMWGLDDGIHLFTLHPKYTDQELHGNGWHWDEVKRNWTFDDCWIGKRVKLVAYANCDSVIFNVNGKETEVPVHELKAELVTEWQPGWVKAVAVSKSIRCDEDVLYTSGKTGKIVLKGEEIHIPADGMSIAYIRVKLEDEQGQAVIDDDREITVKVSGTAELAGVGSGNPCTDENYTDHRRLYDGYALIAVRSGKDPGEAKITVQSDGIGDACISIYCE